SQCLLPPLGRIDPVDGQVDPLPLERLLPPDTGTQRAHDHDSAGVTLTHDLHSGECVVCQREVACHVLVVGRRHTNELCFFHTYNPIRHGTPLRSVLITLTSRASLASHAAP